MANMYSLVEESFVQYAGAVLQSRALVDARDALKPSARQIFYCLYTDKFLPTKPFKKTLKAIGSVARMYIHGDSSAEGVIMRAGQPFAMRYPLIEVEGNAGNLMQSGNWAATRYTSSRLSNFSAKLFNDIDKDTIEEWRDNYDDTEQYPVVLPSKGYYNIVNGTMGIGVGAGSSIPQFNIKDVNNALSTLLLNPNCDFEDIYCPPDFATGAILLNESEVKESLKNGTGFACKLRSVIDFDPKERCLIVTEIPYGVYTNTICGELEAILNDELNNPGIERFNDLTGSTPLIKIYLKKKANVDRTLKYLYKNTSLQYYYGINMTMLEDGRFPRVFTWKEALSAHIAHEKEVYRRGFLFDLNKIEKRLHIIDGLLICMANIEEVVQTIKNSSTTAEASKNLQNNYLLDEVQAKAVLEMKLSRLAHLEVNKLISEKEDLEKERNRIREILDNEDLFNKELIEGWKQTSEKFGDSHRTKIMDLSSEENEPIEIKQLALSFTNKGAVFVSETSSLYTQKRNGVGSKFKLEDSEFIVDNIIGETTDTVLFFTSHGNFYHMKMNDFSLEEKQYLSNFVTVLPYETIISAAPLNKKDTKNHILFVTKNGIIKKTELSEYNLKRSSGATAIKLDKDDLISSILFVDEENIGILSKNGNFIIIETKDIRSIGRVARGVSGMKLNAGDEVVSAKVIPNDTKQVLSITSEGYSKRSPIEEFRITGRGTKGVKIQKGETLCDFLPVNNSNDVLIVSQNSQIRVKMSDISELSRGAQGTKTIKLSNSKIIKILTI